MAFDLQDLNLVNLENPVILSLFTVVVRQDYKIYLIYKIQSHSKDILSAAAVAHGEKSSDTIANAPSKLRCGDGLVPIMLASTAPAPKIRAGM